MTRQDMIHTFCDTVPEVHAFVHGIYAGITEWRGTDLPDNVDIRAEPHYFKGGYILGTLARWGAIIVIGNAMVMS